MASVDTKPDSTDATNEEKVKTEQNREEVKTEQNGESAKKDDVTNGDADSLQQQIIHQIEYYFGDINLPRDKFMLEQIKLDKGWIPMSTMLKFQRLAKLTSDPKVITDALTHSQLMEVNESDEEIKIRRSPEHPLPELNEERRKELQERSIYCKGFPLDYKMDNLIEFFSPYEPYENIVMRKFKDPLTKTFKFKGSVFITFSDKEKASKFLELESVKVNDTELIRKWQLVYMEEKKQELIENRLKRGGKKSAAKEIEPKETLPKGATVHFKGDFGGISREDIKQKILELGYETAFIAFNKGDKEAYVRLHEENSGKALISKIGLELEILESKLEARLIEGEEEDAFLKKAIEDRNAYFRKCQQARQSGRKGKGNRNKNPRKRKGDSVDDSPPPKKPVE